jgi:hypothetical protein
MLVPSTDRSRRLLPDTTALAEAVMPEALAPLQVDDHRAYSGNARR